MSHAGCALTVQWSTGSPLPSTKDFYILLLIFSQKLILTNHGRMMPMIVPANQITVDVSSKLICPNYEFCSWGAKCVPRREHFPEITKEARAWPGLTSCISVPAKTRFCGVIHYDPCLHFRWYLLPQYNATYRVDKITGHTCQVSTDNHNFRRNR